jgi:oxygen-independent coproporphyrinogen III oxidase
VSPVAERARAVLEERSPTATPCVPGEWQADPGFGVYVHIPFCTHRCHYCDFNTYEGQEALHQGYVDALIDDIGRSPVTGRLATSVFFGGGTPTVLDVGQLGRILEAVREGIGIAEDAEITVEANPETVDEATYEALLSAGFNRTSMGVQSLVPRVLVGLGRTHSPEVALEALRAARRAGFRGVNADLIYGSPWESEDDWLASLEGILEVGPDHVSAYALTVEEGTPLHRLVAQGRLPDVDPDVQAHRHEVACGTLGGAGYDRYEVSNWAIPGRASRHNVLYWSAGEYAGFGAGAHSHIAGRRSWATRLPRDFVSAVSEGRSVEGGAEILDLDARAGEALMLGLRLSSGVDLPAFSRRYGAAALETRETALSDLQGMGLLERSGDHLRLSDRATLVANEALCMLL